MWQHPIGKSTLDDLEHQVSDHLVEDTAGGCDQIHNFAITNIKGERKPDVRAVSACTLESV
jgi:hypothetical protein